MKQSVLTRYRALAYTTGVLLILLTIGVISKYILKIDGAEGFTRVVAIAHGWLYVAYLVLAFDLGSKARWKFGKLAWVLLAGTIPTAAFFVERRVTREIQPLIAAAAESESETGSGAAPVKA
jgi:integral membrane protein